MKVSLIISYYKNEANLSLIFKGLAKQSEKDFEVIVAEDDNNASTDAFIDAQRKLYDFPIELISQEKDDGFRKNQMLNRAVLLAKAAKICFVDGDCVPHKHFIRTYDKMIKTGLICFGKRVNLGPKITQKIYDTNDLSYLNFGRIVTSDATKVKEGLFLPFSLKFKDTGLLGCNWGVLKSHLLEINGFDEDYISAGVGEDVDIEWRLRENGLKMISTKNKAIVYHLYHKRGYSEQSVEGNYVLLENKQELGNIQCLNGIEKLKRF